MTAIYHITTAAAWQEAVAQGGPFQAPSLGLEGFIHCSTSEQAAWVANQRFRGSAQPLVLLRLDPHRLNHELKWETSEAGRPPFPHIYGPINLDAVTQVLAFDEGPTGFYPPAE